METCFSKKKKKKERERKKESILPVPGAPLGPEDIMSKKTWSLSSYRLNLLRESSLIKILHK